MRMKSFFIKYKVFFVGFTLLSGIILALFYNALLPPKQLPIYQPAMVNFKLVDSSLQHVKKYHKIAPFSLVNQNGVTITDETYRNKIYVADFFFTTCPTICPIMTDHMVQLQTVFKNDVAVLLLSHSVPPEIDSVAQLKKYALEKGVLDHKWNLVTGNKKEIYNLARASYLAVQEDGDGGPYHMIHTENFILIDPEKRIRGFYDGTNPNAIQTLIDDIEILKSEFPEL